MSYSRFKAAALVGAAWQLAAPACAQPAGPGAASIGEIVVTGRRTEERLQDVPISISALFD